jgi:hypothetical protein
MKKHDYIFVPIELCKFALVDRKVKQVALWLTLKHYTSGHFQLTSDLISLVCGQVGYKSKRTFQNHLDWLIYKKWITVNGKSGSHRLIGISQLSKMYKYKSAVSAKIYKADIKTISGFFSAAAITYCIQKIKKKIRGNRIGKSTIHIYPERIAPIFLSL